ncbi:DUF3883 domain-containing protein [Alteromonas sp. ALT199]|uniref:protein NO VEIN domain-containing protein n=1 Tax=unclassified Alteromonas TaxID=2614992 RepID=UPI001BE6CB15|nr:DUF3883 domain-containing protein [Alteromonas sp. ALT199]MBT3136135.1 DUF3883 domain-containing protein [Alteromonas sp. ALT199]
MYRVPEEFFVRLHHCRPRFKNDRENVLLFIASELCLIGELPEADFAKELNSAIKRFPGNSAKKGKTIDNWRTEISSLLGLIEYTEDNTCKPSQMAEILNNGQDLIEFFRFFCYKFQYPGGHLKPKKSLELIKLGVKFKPVGYILKLLVEANKNSDKKFGISKEEATHCIFNDLRVVRDHRAVEDTISIILNNRSSGIEYDGNGDIIRYAGDILDYMVLANLLDFKPNGKYYIRTVEPEVINTICHDDNYFPEYEPLYNQDDLELQDITATQLAWFRYVNTDLNAEIFETDIFSIVDKPDDDNESTFIAELLDSIRVKQRANGKVKTKEIGDVGEAIAIQHEQVRLRKLDRDDLAKKVVKMPEALAAGYDLNSYEGIAEKKRCIEVKTTISRNKLNIQRFHLTPTEWGAADTYQDAYYVYRLMISAKSVTLFIMRNPVKLYKNDIIDMTPRDGVDITYNGKSGKTEEVLS